MPSPTGYRITFNVFNDSPTGHVNVTFSGPDGPPQTFGNNTNNGEWGVRTEELEGRTYFSTHHDVSADQFYASRNLVSEITGGEHNSYGLIFRNCVDFVRKVAEFGGLGTDVSSLFQWVDTPVNYYASITDWLRGNGFGDIMDGIGWAVGGLGELGEIGMNAAGRAWDWAVGVGEIAYDWVSDIGDQIGGFASDLWGQISDFFGSIFGSGSGGTGGTDTPVIGRSSYTNDDDFILAGADKVGVNDNIDFANDDLPVQPSYGVMANGLHDPIAWVTGNDADQPAPWTTMDPWRPADHNDWMAL